MPLRLDLAVDVVLPAHGEDASAPRRHAHVPAEKHRGVRLRRAASQTTRQSRDRARSFDQQVL